MTKTEEQTTSLPCNDNSKYGTITLEDEGVCISLRSNNPLSNAVECELINYKDILSVNYDKGFILSKWPKFYIKTASFSKKLEMNVPDRGVLKQFARELNSRILMVKNPEKPPEQTLGQKLKEAKELLDMGALSQEEFDNLKQRYLDEF